MVRIFRLDGVLITLSDGVSWKMSSVVVPNIDFLLVNIDAVVFNNLVVSVVVCPSEVFEKFSSLEQHILDLSVQPDVSTLFLFELDDQVVDFFRLHGDLDGDTLVIEWMDLVLLDSSLSSSIESFLC